MSVAVSHASQRGMTIVELLVAMVVTAIVLIGLTGVLYHVTGRYQAWIDQVNTASTGVSLAAALQADSHRYLMCAVSRYELDFCLPNDPPSKWAVQYLVTANSPYAITRQVAHDKIVFTGRGLKQDIRPHFSDDCIPATGTVSGHIHVRDFRQDTGSPENFSVYFRAALGGCAQFSEK
jgi:prepilin-type N-terminal cleavage/methylation domain-containing protein